MATALAINVAILAATVAGGAITGSLALLADAGHVLSDVGAIAIGLAAGAVAGRPAGARSTFGYQRTEVLAALVNGLALVAVAVLIVVTAVGRLDDPPELAGGGVLAFGLAGLAGNIAATVVLAGGRREDLNLEGVLRHSVADALGSLGVIATGAVIALTGWEQIDPLVSLAIASLILASSWRLIADPFAVLMEAAPARLDPEAVAREMVQLEGVREVHDLHVWTLTAGFEALAAHVVVDRDSDRDLIRRQLEVLIRDRYGISHTTLQMEEEGGPELLSLDS
jgi:cobalt-zinc-cadmium efflux system protein